MTGTNDTRVMYGCTGLTASWCPVCGDCACPRDSGGYTLGGLDDQSCPLHRPGSLHAELPLPRPRMGLVTP